MSLDGNKLHLGDERIFYLSMKSQLGFNVKPVLLDDKSSIHFNQQIAIDQLSQSLTPFKARAISTVQDEWSTP